ncbi:MAG: hypothetical protein JXJ22_12705 [Bacteroidales bacterium]|nr:hypothetical protein [Bacteroidales bacterium]
MFGSRINGEAGFKFDEQNKFMFGVDFLHEMGSNKVVLPPDFIMYYQLNKKNVEMFAGSFPKRDVISMPRVLMDDSIFYYKPLMEGIFLNWKNNLGYVNGWIDWTSKQTKSEHEAFIVGQSMKLQKNHFFYKHDFLMYHFAHTAQRMPDDYIRDNGGLVAVGGFEFKGEKLKTLQLSVGLAMSYDRKRGLYDLIFSSGLYHEFLMEYDKFGIRGNYYHGSSRLETSEGSWKKSNEGLTVLQGDKFYKSGDYGRLDIYFMPLKKNRIQSKIQLSVHLIPGAIDYSQQFYLFINIDGKRDLKNRE